MPIDLQQNRTTELTCAKNLLASIKAAHREPTESESTRLRAHLDQVGVLDRQIKGQAVVQSVMRLGNAETDHDNSTALFDSEAKAGIVHAAKSRTSYRTEVSSKAVITSGTLLPTSGTLVEGGLHPTSQFPLSTLFPNQAADGPSQRYYRTTAGTASIVAEGALKPDSGVSFAPVDVLLSKLVALAQYSDEMAEDAGFLIQFLQAELVAAVLAAENKLILDTFTGTSGVLSTTGTAVSVVDLIADAIAAQQSISGMTPSAIVASPSVVATIRKAKASTAGSYMVDPLSAAPTMLHGVPLIATPAAAPLVVWVVCGPGVVVYRRGGVAVTVGSNGTDFAQNVQTVIAEERVAVGVTRPSSLSKVTLT